MDDARTAWKNARNIESLPEGRELELFGKFKSRANNQRVYVLYRCNEGEYWYRTMFLTDRGVISEYDYIFGKDRKK